jgi:uncharacterized membrane protein SpoIIM required for sporulation
MVSLSPNSWGGKGGLGGNEPMISTRWLEKRKPYWSRLEQLISHSNRRDVSAFQHLELQELGLLYRQTASDLAVVREDVSSPQLASYLNQLLGRAHNLIYMGGRPKLGEGVRFFAAYPRIFRQMLPQITIAFLLFAVSALVGWVTTLHDPAFSYRLLGPQMIDSIERRHMWTDSIVTVKPLAASAILTNNLSVSFATFALGITAGIGTFWMLTLNGLMMGVVGAATWRAGMAMQLWSFVAPHGVLELPAIFIAGGAGLELARGMLFPGFLRRGESLTRAGQRAARLVVGIVPMLIIAGIIEGFVSPSELPAAFKFLLAAVLFILLILFLTSGRRVNPAAN